MVYKSLNKICNSDFLDNRNKMKLFALILSAALASPLTKGRARRQDLETTDGDYVEYADYDADGNPADGGRGKICYRFLHGIF